MYMTLQNLSNLSNHSCFMAYNAYNFIWNYKRYPHQRFFEFRNCLIYILSYNKDRFNTLYLYYFLFFHPSYHLLSSSGYNLSRHISTDGALSRPHRHSTFPLPSRQPLKMLPLCRMTENRDTINSARRKNKLPATLQSEDTGSFSCPLLLDGWTMLSLLPRPK